MDKRTILEPGSRLLFPKMECEIASFVGRGSNAMVYTACYPDKAFPALRHKVLIKELFPFHPQAQIFRDGQGDICWTKEGVSVMDLHRLSFQRANEVHIKLLESCPGDLDANINTFSLHRTLYTVFGFSGGRSLEEELSRQSQQAVPLSAHVRRMAAILDVLEAFHQSGYLHLDISPDNILLIGEGRRERVTLIDFNSVHTLQEIRGQENLYYSAKEGFTAPEISSGQAAEIGYPADLYSLAAVFYSMLTGKKLSLLQAVSRRTPDLSDAPCLAAAPDTVRSMARKILKRGLAALTAKRYQTAAQMRWDLEELQNRIEGKGITHPALWETGRANILGAIRANPALSYLQEEEKQYPILGETEAGEAIGLKGLIEEMVSEKGSSIFLLGTGGAGKTTALMRAAYLQPPRYCAANPAFIYLSLYGWSENQSGYIKGRILESLRFKSGTESMEMAMHELLQMLSEPMQTRQGERPKLVILLDGLNEAREEISGLLQEIAELSAMPGVRILLAGRSEAEGIDFPRVRLRPLEQAEVKHILGKNGLLPPERQSMAELLRTPMMLSMYIQAALCQEKQLSIQAALGQGKQLDIQAAPGQGRQFAVPFRGKQLAAQPLGKQLAIQSQEQLLDSYFAAILAKERRELPEDAPERWQAEAALFYVLPEIAQLMERKGCALSDQEMLPTVEKCYRRIKKRTLVRVFPQWIGHSADIRSGAENGEGWYGIIIHRILWRRLGLLVRDAQGNYRTAHPLMEEYLVRRHKGFAWKFACYEKGRMLLFALACALCIGGASQAFLQAGKKEPYEESISENVLDAAFAAYITCGRQYGYFVELLECIEDGEADGNGYERALRSCQEALGSPGGVSASQASGYLEQLYQSGEAMPWSGEPLEREGYEELVALPKERAEEYGAYLQVLCEAKKDQGAWEFLDGREFVEKLRAFLDLDAMVLGKYYSQLVLPELQAMEQSESEEEWQLYGMYMKTYATVKRQNEQAENLNESIEVYQGYRRQALRELQSNGISSGLRKQEERE